MLLALLAFGIVFGVSTTNVAAEHYILVFSDATCPFSALQATELASIRATERVEIVVKHFPSAPVDSDAFRLNEAVVEAERQGKLWQFSDELFRQRTVSLEHAERVAESVGLDRRAFKNAMRERVHRQRVLSDLIAGKALGIAGSPTVFVDSERIDGVLTRKKFSELVSHTTP